MSEITVNSDLLKCENDFFTKESKTKSLLITKNAIKNSIISKISESPIKTERISSSVLSRTKLFLDKTKNDVNIGEKCDLVDDNNDDCEDNNKPIIEMNLMLFKDNQLSNKDSSDEESDSTESSQSSSEDSDEDSPHNSDSEHISNNKNICDKNDN